jgi:NADPH:quinone reductase-like Zn-dependent oxidoreductase
MKAAFLTKHAGPEGVTVGDLAPPNASQNEVMIRVHATAVTPTEFDWFPTFKAQNGEPRPFPIVLSHEFSGVVAETGKTVTGISVGDSIYGMNDWFANGAQAEYCIAPASSIAPKPNSLADALAAVVPISALTAWQGLFDHGRLQPGERVLIQGGAGAVGSFAVQLARWRGAYVLATASAPSKDFVAGLGADEVIDYQATPFESVAHDIDLVFDTVGGDTLKRSWSVLGTGGRLVTIATQSEATNDDRTRKAFFIVEPSRAQLSEVARLLDTGILRAFVAEVFALESVREAYARAQQGGLRGKIALEIKDGL